MTQPPLHTGLYTGRGAQNTQGAAALPAVDLKSARRPEGYRATVRLAAAVEVALTLGMPLLLTGEPGSGKSELAYSLAWELGLEPVLRFPVKSDTESRDLFYRFDTVGRFHAAQSTQDAAASDPARFITFEALGQAILLAQSAADVQKALRLPPDHAFQHSGTLGPQAPLPEDRVTVDTIVAARLGHRYLMHDEARGRVNAALDFCAFLRSDRLTLERRPTLAELLN